ncbi:LysR family transcriptional regulator [Paraburkholderia sp.]|uniref:LysR family transcriptional regulator n=1 Tax=Paraburkholderia sp. TaxID=1926495 RepID=UPI002389F844|nr:LysR family transcriptional regulator [Paraburkholderia sp.]MDE1182313.1 LysR family transcriptional regulator [Paraburkholderia sp.]
MKIHQLRALVAIASSGSINGAAKALHVTQPAITKAVQELESEFGVRLLERNQWGVVPTPEGAALLNRARTVVREMERAEEDMAHLKGLREGSLIIGITPIAGTAGMAEAFDEFRKRWPLVKVEFRELGFNQLNEQLRNRTLDLAFAAFGKPPADSGTIKEIVSFDTLFVTRANGAYANADTLEALQEAEWIHTDVTDNYPSYIRAMHERLGLPTPRRITRCTSYALFYSLTMNTDAIFNWTRHSLEATPHGLSFVPLALAVQPPSLPLYLLSPPAAQLTRPAEYFVDCLERTIETLIRGNGVNPQGATFAAD